MYKKNKLGIVKFIVHNHQLTSVMHHAPFILKEKKNIAEHINETKCNDII